MTFTKQPMQEILAILQTLRQENKEIQFKVLNPDVAEVYAGTLLEIEDVKYIYRGYKAWTDLAELLHMRMLTPQRYDDVLVSLKFKVLERHSFHYDEVLDRAEKYGVASLFAKIYKMEEPAFIYYYSQALENIGINKRKRVLNLGVNRGDEFEVIEKMLKNSNTLGSETLVSSFNEAKAIVSDKYTLKYVGIDHSQTAIDFAKNRFSKNNFSFYAHDINALDALDLGVFDVLISIGTLQSPSINFKPFFMSLVQNYLEANSALILGFPNSAPNYAMSEQSLLYNDIMFAKKYLQQHKYRVSLTGKYYVFLTATKII